MHYPGHLREAFITWAEDGCPPTVELEVAYEPVRWPPERFLRRMLRCSDIVPQDIRALFPEWEAGRRRTFASLAYWLLDDAAAA